MSPGTRVSLVALAIAVTAVATAACGSARAAAATVDGTDITDAQLAHEVDLYAFLAELNQQPCGTKEQGETADAACARFTLSNLIQQRFVENYASAHDVSVAAKDVTAIIQNLNGSVGNAQVESDLATFHLTHADLRTLARRVLVFQEVRKAVAADELTDDALRALYQQQLLSFTTIQVDHILVKTKAEAENVYRQVTAPGATEQDFLNLAKRVSIDPSAKQNSGSLGSAVASTYDTDFATAAVTLEPGQVSRPVHTQFGWHVIRMVDKEITPFEQAKSQLVSSQSATVFNDWIRGRATNGSVDVNPKYGRYDTQSLQVVRISSTASNGGPASASPSAVNGTP
jgi:foldase protein PrsA